MQTIVMFVVGALGALGAARGAWAATWEIDGARSRVQFTIRNFLVTTVTGTFHSVRGTAVVPDDDPVRAHVTAAIEVASIDTGIERRDEHLKSADYFDASRFPTMAFASKRVERVGDGRYRLVGDLTLHGITREVALAVEGPAPPATNPPAAGERTNVSATTSLDRTDFGLTGGFVVGDEVDVHLAIELVKRE